MRIRVLGLAVLLVAGGCTSPPDGPSQPTPVEYPKVEVPKDRDERAVVAALRRLDACALLDPIGANKPAANGPHRCAVAGDDHIRVALGVRFDRQHRYRAVPLDLGGAKAYVDTSEPGDDSCQVAIPVSFTLTIAVFGRKGPRSGAGDICALTKAAATIAVSRMANPPAGAGGWTACELLADIAGDAVLENDDLLGLDMCRGLERGADGRPGRQLFRINLDNGDDPTVGAENVKTVAGQRVTTRSDNAGCSFSWSAGSNRVVTFSANDCAKGEQLVPELITALAAPNPDRTSPQRPLLIRPDEPDEPLAGACVDFPYSLNCQPSTDLPVPPGAQPALIAAAADSRVACALAGDAVRVRFGTTLNPVLASRTSERPDCYFVEPSHSSVIEVFISPDDDLADAVPTGNGQDLTVAGRPAKSASIGDDRRLCVLPVSGAKTGLLCVIAHFLPGRGRESDTKADTGKVAQLEPAVADIVSKYFS